MLKSFLEKLRGKQQEPVGLEDALRLGATRFREWAATHSSSGVDVLAQADEALQRLKDEKGELSDAAVNDAAAFLGEEFRNRHDGRWIEHPVFGLIIGEAGGLPHGKFLPLAVIEHKWAAGDKWSLAKLFESISNRLDAERKIDPPERTEVEEIAGRLRSEDVVEASHLAAQFADEFRAFWKQRFRVDLPLSLTGVREVDGFLRSHYHMNFLEETQLVQAGFFLGEVARGLFEGEWSFQDCTAPQQATLRWPEIDYYPVGRIYKMMTEQPTGEPLDEYVRLVPSARKEMREQQ